MGSRKNGKPSWLVPDQCRNQHTHTRAHTHKQHLIIRKSLSSRATGAWGQAWAMELLPLCVYPNMTPFTYSTVSLWKICFEDRYTQCFFSFSLSPSTNHLMNQFPRHMGICILSKHEESFQESRLYFHYALRFTTADKPE